MYACVGLVWARFGGERVRAYGRDESDSERVCEGVSLQVQHSVGPGGADAPFLW